MRKLAAAAFLALLSGPAAAQNHPPLPPGSQRASAERAWFAHAIDRLLDGTGGRIERREGRSSAHN